MRNPFDHFAKQMTRACYAPAGQVETDAEVSPDARRIDIWFTPRSPDAREALAPLGLLGRFAHGACTLEAYHRSPGGKEVMDCLCKHHLFRDLLERTAPSVPLPFQWIVSSGRPDTALAGLRFERDEQWGAGIYEAPPLTHTRLVVISELPVTRDTLLVRLMGAGATLQRAIAELRTLPADAPERAHALPILLRLRLEVPAEPAKRTQDDEEFFMSTQDILETFAQEQRNVGRAEGRRDGRQEGRQEGLVEGSERALVKAVLVVYAGRFGAAPADLAEALGHLHDAAALEECLKVAATGTPAQVLAAARRSV